MTVLATLSACEHPDKLAGQCPSVAGRDPIKDADYDFEKGERRLIVFVEGGYAAVPIVLGGDKERDCQKFDQTLEVGPVSKTDERGASGPNYLFKANKRFRQTTPTGDSLTASEQLCADQEPAYASAYNRELTRLYPNAYYDTCFISSARQATR